MECDRLSRQGNNITLIPYKIEFNVILKHFARCKFMMVNESEKTINSEQFTHIPKGII